MAQRSSEDHPESFKDKENEQFVMVLCNNSNKKKPGTSFEAGRSPRARAPGRRRVFSGNSETILDALRRPQKLLEAPRSSQELEKSKFS